MRDDLSPNLLPYLIFRAGRGGLAEETSGFGPVGDVDGEDALDAAVAALFGGLATAAAQDRTPVQRQTLADLAYAIGESHALRQACEGDGDQYWRARMIRLIEVESPDQAFDRRLRGAFNTGFSSARAAHPDCDEGARSEAARVAQRGRDLAQRLSQSAAQAASPDPMAEPPATR